jgi:hypothetical protein
MLFTDAVDSDFDDWWKHVWRKVGPGAARKEYRKARKLTSHQHLVECADKFTQLIASRKVERQFQPHPRTWLYQQRWLDQDTEKHETIEGRAEIKIDQAARNRDHLIWLIKNKVHTLNCPFKPKHCAVLVKSGDVTLKQASEFCFMRPNEFAKIFGLNT